MTLIEAKQSIQQQLSARYDEREAMTIAYMLLEHITGWGRIDQSIHKQASLQQAKEQQLQDSLMALISGKPIQYVLEEAWFYGMRFRVNAHTLIPRPETEELISWALEWAGTDQVQQCMDIGTGSGCIAISIKKKAPAIKVLGIDVSEGALLVAGDNARQNDTAVDWMQLDILNAAHWLQLPSCQLIISNPPYIKATEIKDMAAHVVDFEPHTALFVPDDDPLVFYRAIALLALQKLDTGGKIFMEINQQLGKDVCELLEGHGFQTQLRQDLQGNDRMVCASLP